jgi:hypothetical protein
MNLKAYCVDALARRARAPPFYLFGRPLVEQPF